MKFGTKYYIENVVDFDEIDYNNSETIKLLKQKFAILSGIINSDSNIKPGINYVETTNATYNVYYKETGDFKILGKEISEDYYDEPTKRNISGINATGNAEDWVQIHSSSIQKRKSGTYYDEISNINKGRARISDSGVKDGESNNGNVKYSIEESENNSGSFNLTGNNKTIQLDIINKSNPMQDDYHIGIRSFDDIKKPQEALKDEETLADVSGQLFGNQEFINIQINFISSRVK